MTTPEHFDVLIVGAGLSGIGAGYHLQANCPRKTYAILEGREAIGGTWDLFRYPGIRSDSDMYTLGYSVQAVARGQGHRRRPVDPELCPRDRRRVRHRQAHPLSPPGQARQRGPARRRPGPSRSSGARPARRPLHLRFLYMCAGYYNYAAGYTPEFPGVESFGGRIVHPQFWPGTSTTPARRSW
jgi:monooxygenase